MYSILYKSKSFKVDSVRKEEKWILQPACDQLLMYPCPWLWILKKQCGYRWLPISKYGCIYCALYLVMLKLWPGLHKKMITYL